MTMNHETGNTNHADLVRVSAVNKYFMRGSEWIDVLKGVSLQIPQGGTDLSGMVYFESAYLRYDANATFGVELHVDAAYPSSGLTTFKEN